MRVVLEIIAAIFRWIANRSEPAAVEAKRKADLEKRQQAAKAEIDKALRERKEDDVNDFLDRVLTVAYGFALAVVLSGCASVAPPREVVYIPASEKVVYLELAGQPGWWVPEKVFARMMQKLAVTQEE